MSSDKFLKEDSKHSTYKSKPFMRFSSMAFQMMVTIGAGAWGGSALDNHYQNEKPIWTIVLSLSGIAISLYLVIRSAQKMSKDD